MITLTTYLVSYLITLLGFSLGKATKSEHKEIKTNALFFAKAFVFTIYGALLTLTFGDKEFFLIIVAISLYFLGEFKFKQLKELNYLIAFALSFFILKSYNYFEFFPLILFAIIIEHSFKKFSIKEIIYSIIILLLFYTIGIA